MRKLSLFFVPQTDNNYRALLLRPSFLSLFIAIYLLNQSFLKSITLIKPGILGYSSEITAEKVIEQTNQQRQKYDLPPLRLNSLLSQSARLKAEDMFADNYWAHTSPSGRLPWQFIKNAGYQYSIAGENLAKDFYDTSSMIKAWMRSPTHRDNIIHQKYQEIGIAVVDGILGGVKTTLVVQHFGTPLIAAPAVGSQTGPAIAVSAGQEQSSVLSQTSAQFSINPTTVRKILGGVMFGIIIITLFVDGYLTLKNKTKRLTGSSIGHISFLAIILMLLLFTRQGSVF